MLLYPQHSPCVLTTKLAVPSDATFRDGDGGRETVQRVAEEGVVRRNEAPLVLTDVINFAGHVVVAPNDVYFVLEEEGLVRDTELVHGV